MATADLAGQNGRMAADAAVFGNHLKDLLSSDLGRFAVVGSSQLIGIFETYEAAMRAGYARFGLSSFLVKKIEPIEERLTDFHVACLY
jgi:hypothetical protein